MELPRHAEIWLQPYLIDRLMKGVRPKPPKRVWVTIADHFEPYRATTDDELARARVRPWRQRWPEIALRHPDSTGRPAQYSFFYPQEEYRAELLDSIAEMVQAGLGDVEIHIHHDSGGPQGGGQQEFLDRMQGFIEVLRERHELLRQHQGKTVFGFIHGNWALDNSLPGGRACGLNNEISLLRELGCYADFTMPCGPHHAQARTLNTIYWATDDPDRPKSYDYGEPVREGKFGSGDLLMIPGPLGLRWNGRLLPNLEIGELAWRNGPSPARIERWLHLAPRIGSELFLKLFTHGAWENNTGELLDGGLEKLFSGLTDASRRHQFELRYATAWEMRQAVERACLSKN